MKIMLEELPHQKKALEAIIESFPGMDMDPSSQESPDYVYANPLIKNRYSNSANIDVKMETGTGKTYIGVRTMYELHQRFGLFKFIVVVPGPAIKEGWRSFMIADYSRQHFAQFYENDYLTVNVINAGDFSSRSGRRNFPVQLTEFAESTRQNEHDIEVLLINEGMLTSSSLMKDYDGTLLSGITRPLEALRETRPVVIIDEPHRFALHTKGYKKIEAMHPQMIIRLGATFPETVTGRGKNKVIKPDYYRGKPQFELNAIDSFNDGLIKAIDVYYPNLPQDQVADAWRVEQASARKLVLNQGRKARELSVGDSLADVDASFEGNVTYSGAKTLSNGLVLDKGMKLIPGTFTNVYQETMLRSAIERHFDAEQTNFLREQPTQPRVKTLSLFFIDSIDSYRQRDGWLRTMFEKLLREKLEELIKEYEYKDSVREREYLEFLRATMCSLQSASQKVHAGYFSEDHGSGDAAIQAEVDDIINNKEEFLSFKNTNNDWNLRRFLFSKWTLREGWDNPNVFVIAKLRSSGSENSKIQEVGRGLRLPVDEQGHRLQQDELPSRLSFLVGFDEHDFASKLIEQVNSEVEFPWNHHTLDDKLIAAIISSLDNQYNDRNELLKHLENEGIIDRSNDFLEDGFIRLHDEFPRITSQGVRPGRITDGGPKDRQRTRLNLPNWNKMRDLWRKLSSRYMLKFNPVGGGSLQEMVNEVFGNTNNFTYQYTQTVKNEIASGENNNLLALSPSTSEEGSEYPLPGMAYGRFVEKLARTTRLQPKIIHTAMRETDTQYSSDRRYFNEETIHRLLQDFRTRFDQRYKQGYEYEPLNFTASTSVYNPDTDDFKTDILASIIGIHEENNVATSLAARQLYEIPPLRYDSANPELSLLQNNYRKEIIAFGKLPKKAIQIPKYTGGSTTPDFVFMLQDENNRHLYLIVETKAEGSNKRISDAQITDIQQHFFEKLESIGIQYIEASRPEEVYATLRILETMQQ
jgi:type III restriction enzyme